jgi:hypothetical protein
MFKVNQQKSYSYTPIQFRTLLKYITHSWSWALLEKPQFVQLLKNFPAFYLTRGFITVFTRAVHLFLSWARSSKSIPPHSISLRFVFKIYKKYQLNLGWSKKLKYVEAMGGGKVDNFYCRFCKFIGVSKFEQETRMK